MIFATTPQQKKSSRRGFTLIEMMITITIIGTLTVLAAQAINQAIKAKIKLQDQIDDVSKLRDAVRLMERDINLAYHYRDLETEMQKLIQQKVQGGNGQQQQSQSGQNPQQQQQQLQQQQAANNAALNQQREVPRIDPETHFVGTEETIDFVTMNNARTVKNTQQADFVEVGYALKDCKSLREDKGNSKCLWRRSSPYVDTDVTKGGTEVVLLENVTEFKLKYIGKGKQDWVKDWRSDAGGDGATKGKFPQAVEISITTNKKENGRQKKYSMNVVAPIHFLNNPEEGGQQNGQATPNQQQGAPATPATPAQPTH
jgi:prepilin-type N-terminal cleavage/methylation domain-containing protein